MIYENDKTQMMETFISMKMDAEYNETTLSISFDRVYEEFDIFSESQSHHNSYKKKPSRTA